MSMDNAVIISPGQNWPRVANFETFYRAWRAAESGHKAEKEALHDWWKAHGSSIPKKVQVCVMNQVSQRESSEPREITWATHAIESNMGVDFINRYVFEVEQLEWLDFLTHSKNILGLAAEDRAKKFLSWGGLMNEEAWEVLFNKGLEKVGQNKSINLHLFLKVCLKHNEMDSSEWLEKLYLKEWGMESSVDRHWRWQEGWCETIESQLKKRWLEKNLKNSNLESLPRPRL